MATTPLRAQLDGDGYYRVQNVTTERYISIVDNKSNTETATTEPDLGALISIKPFATIVDDPSTIIYIEYNGVKNSNNYYNLYSQGIDVYSILSHWVFVMPYTKSGDYYGTYRAWGEDSGNNFYICDNTNTTNLQSTILSNSTNKYWNILPVSASDDDNYFAFTPTISAGGKYYGVLYCSFAYKAASDGVKFYYVTQISGEKAFYNEIDGTVPAGTPVIVECSSEDYSDNRLEIVSSDESAPSDNLMGGVYFHSYKSKHVNLTMYDSETMRILGTLSDGSLGFYKADESDFTYTYSAETGSFPANYAYLNVSSSDEDELVLLDITTGIKSIANSESKPSAKQGVYNLAGIKVADDAKTSDLSPGVYISGGKKIVIR